MEINSEYAWYMLPLMFIVCTVFGGGNEELGWRGTFQPLLERTVSKKIKNPIIGFLVLTLIIGAIWAVWHLPLWFVEGTPQQSMPFYLFAIAILFESIFLSCIYTRTHSVFYCMLFHGLTNTLMGFFIMKVNWLLVIGYAILTLISVFLATRNNAKTATITIKSNSTNRKSTKKK